MRRLVFGADTASLLARLLTADIRCQDKVAAGCILAIPASRGSSTTTAVLLEAVRRGTAPAALITSETDTFLVLASVVADELYHKPIPVLAIQAEEFETLEDGQHAELSRDGSLRITDST